MCFLRFLSILILPPWPVIGVRAHHSSSRQRLVTAVCARHTRRLKLGMFQEEEGGRAAGMSEDRSNNDANAVRLAQVRAALECPCCSELLKSPVIFRTCGHCFCSVCIRRWLLSKRSCPQCNGDADQEDLIPCFAVARVLNALSGTSPGSIQKDAGTLAEQVPPRLPLVVYHLTSDEKLDEYLRGFGLPAQRTREMKILLHREFTLAYNSQIDAGCSAVDLPTARKAALDARSSGTKSGTLFSGNNKPSSSSASLNNREEASGHSKKRALSTSLQIYRERKRLRKREQSKYRGAVVSAGWRAVFSDFLDRPVYYNSITKECTVSRPMELETPVESSGLEDDEKYEAEDNEVIVVVDTDTK